MIHIEPQRLFDLSQTDTQGLRFQLETWEKEHLRECDECQQLLQIFARQFNGKKPQNHAE